MARSRKVVPEDINPNPEFKPEVTATGAECKLCVRLQEYCYRHKPNATIAKIDGRRNPNALKPQERVFISQYLVDYNVSRAAVAAQYAPTTGIKLLHDPRISKEIEKRIGFQDKRLGALGDRVLLEMASIALAQFPDAFDGNGVLLPIDKLPDFIRAAAQSIKTTEIIGDDGQFKGFHREVSLHNKIVAGKLVLDRLGIAFDRTDPEERERERQRANSLHAPMNLDDLSTETKLLVLRELEAKQATRELEAAKERELLSAGDDDFDNDILDADYSEVG